MWCPECGGTKLEATCMGLRNDGTDPNDHLCVECGYRWAQTEKRPTPITCGTCKHWGDVRNDNDSQDAAMVREKFGVAVCGAVPHIDVYHSSAETPDPMPMAMVADGSDYFAALRTRETFGCNLWEEDK